MSRHLAIHFARFGPYHFTRLRSARQALEPTGWKVTGLETAGRDDTYGWDGTGLNPSALRTVFPRGTYERIPAGEMRRGIRAALDEMRPDAVAIAGWGTPDAVAALDWCGKHGAFPIVMSETRAADGHRRWWREWLKSRRIRRFGAALVGGQAHREYLQQLGMPGERIETGYDVVDNEHFEAETDRQRPAGEKNPPYFLASSRFIERKNLWRLVDAHARYRRERKEAPAGADWNLVLLGAGDGREELERQVRETGIEGVIFPGFQQIDALPRWYAGAGAFVHPALAEPWGLVINEAMAAGLPVLCSTTTGAGELVEEGVTGFRFEPTDTAALAGLLARMAAMPAEERRRMGQNAREKIRREAPAAAFGKGLAKLLASGPG